MKDNCLVDEYQDYIDLLNRIRNMVWQIEEIKESGIEYVISNTASTQRYSFGKLETGIRKRILNELEKELPLVKKQLKIALKKIL